MLANTLAGLPAPKADVPPPAKAVGSAKAAAPSSVEVSDIKRAKFKGTGEGCSLTDPPCLKAAFKAGYCARHYNELSQNGGISAVEEKEVKQGGKGEDRWWELKGEAKSVWQACKNAEGLDYYYNVETRETTWDKPEELMTPEELDRRGAWFWVPDEELGFTYGRALTNNGKKAEMELESGERRVVSSKVLQELKRSSLQRIVQDLVLLDDMCPPLILHNLKMRYAEDKIYTGVGTILISVNPYQRLPIYGPEILKQYASKKVGTDLPPHVFNIAHDAWYGLTEFGKNQSIIISGESGAGKTEATKQCLQFLAHVAGSSSGVETKVLEANPILEAFGNAKTLRNDNSSRFGKYLEIYLRKGRIVSSVTRNYLLEKIRVCRPMEGERNYHIFYQLTQTAKVDKVFATLLSLEVHIPTC